MVRSYSSSVFVDDGVQAGEDAGIVDHHIESAVLAYRGVDEVLHRRVAASVCLERTDLPPVAVISSSVEVLASDS
jgi:hypothetical protein